MSEADEKQKEIVKEALKEWLDEKFASMGRWTAGAFGAALFVGLVYLVLSMHGWHR